jgi:acyl carrier protein
MPADSTVVTGPELMEAVRRLIAEVLIVPLERVLPDSALASDLGAESIDYLDLVFRLEEVLGRPIPISRWQQYLNGRFGSGSLAQAITTRVVVEFACACCSFAPA